MMITRQSSETTIQELVGERCDVLVGVTDLSSKDVVNPAFMRVGRQWFRFFIDVGVLFFEPSEDPADGGDVEEDDETVSLLPSALEAHRFESVRFENGVLEILFAGGSRVRFSEDAETAMMKVSNSW